MRQYYYINYQEQPIDLIFIVISFAVAVVVVNNPLIVVLYKVLVKFEFDA